MCDIEKKTISRYFFFPITIIRQYFAELLCYCADIWLPWTAAVFDILHIMCGQFTSVHIFLFKFKLILTFNKAFFSKSVHILSQICTFNQSIKIIHILSVTKQMKPASSKLIFAEVASEVAFTFMHLADAFIQSDLFSWLYIFCKYVCSLGIEHTIFCAANAMLYHWATGTLDVFTHCLMQLRGTWSALTSYKCIFIFYILNIKHLILIFKIIKKNRK